MIAFSSPSVGRLINYALIGFSLLAILFGAITCYRAEKNATDARQARQTAKTATAYNKAAGDAVNTVSDRVEAEQATDAETKQTQEAIRHAETSDQVHSVVVDAMCRRLHANGRTDPACKL